MMDAYDDYELDRLRLRDMDRAMQCFECDDARSGIDTIDMEAKDRERHDWLDFPDEEAWRTK